MAQCPHTHPEGYRCVLDVRHPGLCESPHRHYRQIRVTRWRGRDPETFCRARRALGELTSAVDSNGPKIGPALLGAVDCVLELLTTEELEHAASNLVLAGQIAKREADRRRTFQLLAAPKEKQP